MRQDVREYYGQILQTNACCNQLPPDWLKPLLAKLHDEVITA